LRRHRNKNFRQDKLDLEFPLEEIPRAMPDKNNPPKKNSDQQQNDLDVSIGFLEGIVGRDPEYIEALQLLGDDYTRRGKFQSGLQIDERLATLRPADPLVQYNLACSYSLLDQPEHAAAALDRALTHGYRDFKWLARDPDLKKFRAHPLYKTIQARIKKLKTHSETK
jgi:tetratricopeptide (TPR) repeat protein